MPTYDLRRAVASALWEAGFEQAAGEYMVKTDGARDAQEAIDTGILPPMIQLDWGADDRGVSHTPEEERKLVLAVG